MKVKDCVPYGKKVIDPRTGKIGIFVNYYPGGVMLKGKKGIPYSVSVTKEEFAEWDITKDYATVRKQDLKLGK